MARKGFWSVILSLFIKSVHRKRKYNQLLHKIENEIFRKGPFTTENYGRFLAQNILKLKGGRF